ncbi:hypothetical protein LLEC1_04768 [Akanthomyces lecanii]|uniref:AAA+ ATPase domain-containing protein n=1 Tax=Cordyceps confragosa TaxID=2714763 RepID=A0A179I255_CORDF|nr:hypothetical protein LLEC1_04768 [Akanthomyces lecanii]
MDPSNGAGLGDKVPKPMPNLPAQLPILDFFFPGFSGLSSLICTYTGIDLTLYLPLLLVISCITFAWSYISDHVWDVIRSHLMSEVRIRTDDEIYNILMAWIVTQRFSQQSRRSIVNTNLNSRSWCLWAYEDEESEDDDGYTLNHLTANKKPLRYTPSTGSHFFWYKGHLLLFDRYLDSESASFLSSSEREELSISCFGRNPKIVKELLTEARANHTKKDEGKTLMYRGVPSTKGDSPSWRRCMSRTSRPISTVILDEKVKKNIIDDVSEYLDPETRRWYSNRGIPYRRGYLLHGPPGTGKSSLSLALAGFFRMPIYMISLNSPFATEEVLATLFAELPLRCVVLLEDIDTAGLTHTRDKNHKEENPDATSNTEGSTEAKAVVAQGKLSLSGLLNILDGVASQEGRVLIMTTNHLEKLDKALIRPGRVDIVVKFSLADAKMATSIFRAIYMPCEGESSSEKSSQAGQLDCGTMRKPKEEVDQTSFDTIDRIDSLSKQFATKIPDFELSPAEIQGFLLKHKRDAEGAVATVDGWVKEMRRKKKMEGMSGMKTEDMKEHVEKPDTDGGRT